jgi:hypothetical protein
MGLVALAVPLFGATSAQADVGTCAFTGAAGPLVPGVQSVATDLADGNLQDVDTGTYTFNNAGAPAPSACLLVDDTNEPDGDNDTGLYSVHITSAGNYANTVCGTGSAIDPDAAHVTAGDLTRIAGSGDGLGEDISDTNYRIDFVAGNGPLQVSSAVNQSGETGSGAGVVNIEPTIGNCVTQDVTQFQATGVFTLVGN